MLRTIFMILLLGTASTLVCGQSATIRLVSDDDDGLVRVGEITTWTLWVEFEGATAAESGNLSLVAENPDLLESSDFVFTPSNGGNSGGGSDGQGGIGSINWTNSLFMEIWSGRPSSNSNPYPVGSFTTTALRNGAARFRLEHDPSDQAFLTLAFSAFSAQGLHSSEVPFVMQPYPIVGLDPSGTDEACVELGISENTPWRVEGGSVMGVETMRTGDTIIVGNFDTVGGVPARGIARYDGAAWHAYGDGIDGNVYTVVQLPSGRLLAAGRLDSRYGSAVVEWKGDSWVGVGQGLENATVRDLAALGNGRVIAGGHFRTSTSPIDDNIAELRGQHWVTFGGGTTGWVEALAVTPRGDLIVGGWFYRVGEIYNSIRYIARWRRNRWEPLGTLPSQVYEVAISPDGRIVASGLFGVIGTDADGGEIRSSIVEWDGEAWVPFGSSQILHLSIKHLQFLETGTLIASGPVMRWDGSGWQSIISGNRGPVIPLGEESFVIPRYGNEYVFGPQPRPPVLVVEPIDVRACAQDRVRLEAFSIGPGRVTYRWQRNDPSAPETWYDLAEGIEPGLGEVSGSGSNVLRVTGVEGSAWVRCVVSNSCASTTSVAARVQLNPGSCCLRADFSGDGVLDADDLPLFVEAFLAGDSAADLNRDGLLDLEDIAWIVRRFENGCG